MYSIELMVEEHENIRRMLKVVQNMCCGILEGNEVVDADFRSFVEFSRNYSDKHHHGKEEKFLFPEMVAKLGPAAEALVTHGMLVEHDLGRAHILATEEALGRYAASHSVEDKLDIVTEAMGYVHLLQRHTDKENDVVYPFAERGFAANEELMALFQDIDQRSRSYEATEDAAAVREKYLGILADMEAKYLN